MPPTRMDVAACPLPELFRLLRSGDAGLAAADAAGLLKQTGPNRIASSSRRPQGTAYKAASSNNPSTSTNAS